MAPTTNTAGNGNGNLKPATISNAYKILFSQHKGFREAMNDRMAESDRQEATRPLVAGERPMPAISYYGNRMRMRMFPLLRAQMEEDPASHRAVHEFLESVTSEDGPATADVIKARLIQDRAADKTLRRVLDDGVARCRDTLCRVDADIRQQARDEDAAAAAAATTLTGSNAGAGAEEEEEDGAAAGTTGNSPPTKKDKSSKTGKNKKRKVRNEEDAAMMIDAAARTREAEEAQARAEEAERKAEAEERGQIQAAYDAVCVYRKLSPLSRRLFDDIRTALLHGSDAAEAST